MGIVHTLFTCLCFYTAVTGFVSLQKKVFSERHFRDVAFHMPSDSHEWVATKPTILVLYTPKCEHELKRGKIKESGLPPTYIVTYLKYDYESFPPLVWYKLDKDENNMKQRFDVKRCPTAVFIGEGDPMDKYQSWTSASVMTFDKWIWNLLKVNIFIGSQYSKQVDVSFEGPNNGPKLDSETLSNGGIRNLNTYIGYKLFITGKQPKQVLYVTTIDLGTAKAKITIDSNTKPIAKSIKEWKNEHSKELINEEKTTHREYNILFMHIRTFKQPLLLGYFTEEGYIVSAFNDHLYEELITFWEHHFWEQTQSKYIKDADVQEYEPWVDCKDIPVKTLKLSTHLKGNVSLMVKKMAEKWLQTELEVVNVQGIHHFKEGHYMKLHVSDANDAITAWVILEKEKHDSHHYFEVINYHTGRQEIVDFIPGEVFIFESSTLILSMHEPLKAEQFFTIVSISFKPKYAWPWVLIDNGAAIEGQDVMGIPLHERMDDVKPYDITNKMPPQIEYDRSQYQPSNDDTIFYEDSVGEEEEISSEQDGNEIDGREDDKRIEDELEPVAKHKIEGGMKETVIVNRHRDEL